MKRFWRFLSPLEPSGICLFFFFSTLGVINVWSTNQPVAKTFRVTFSLVYADMTLKQAAGLEADLRSQYKGAEIDVKVAEVIQVFSLDSLTIGSPVAPFDTFRISPPDAWFADPPGGIQLDTLFNTSPDLVFPETWAY